MTKIVNFLEHADRYHGAWSHFMNGSTGKTMPVFGMFDNGGDPRPDPSRNVMTLSFAMVLVLQIDLQISHVGPA